MNGGLRLGDEGADPNRSLALRFPRVLELPKDDRDVAAVDFVPVVPKLDWEAAIVVLELSVAVLVCVETRTSTLAGVTPETASPSGVWDESSVW